MNFIAEEAYLQISFDRAREGMGVMRIGRPQKNINIAELRVAVSLPGPALEFGRWESERQFITSYCGNHSAVYLNRQEHFHSFCEKTLRLIMVIHHALKISENDFMAK